MLTCAWTAVCSTKTRTSNERDLPTGISLRWHSGNMSFANQHPALDTKMTPLGNVLVTTAWVASSGPAFETSIAYFGVRYFRTANDTAAPHSDDYNEALAVVVLGPSVTHRTATRTCHGERRTSSRRAKRANNCTQSAAHTASQRSTTTAPT